MLRSIFSIACCRLAMGWQPRLISDADNSSSYSFDSRSPVAILVNTMNVSEFASLTRYVSLRCGTALSLVVDIYTKSDARF